MGENHPTRPNLVAGIHRTFDNSLPPILTIEPGETLTFDCPAPFPPMATVESLVDFDFTHPHSLVGPIAIEGASPGDALVVDILDIEVPESYGTCLFRPA